MWLCHLLSGFNYLSFWPTFKYGRVHASIQTSPFSKQNRGDLAVPAGGLSPGEFRLEEEKGQKAAGRRGEEEAETCI